MDIAKKATNNFVVSLDRSGCFCFLCSSLKKRKLQRDQNEKVGHGGGVIQANCGTQMHVNAPSLLYISESRKGKQKCKSGILKFCDFFSTKVARLNILIPLHRK